SGDEDEQMEAALVIDLGGLAAAAGLGSERTGLAPALEQAADPGGADAEQVGDAAAGALALVTGADDPVAEVLRVGVHTVSPFPTRLEGPRYKWMQTALVISHWQSPRSAPRGESHPRG